MTAESIKSPFFVVQNVLEQDECFKLANSLYVQPTKQDDGLLGQTTRKHEEYEQLIFDKLRPYIPQLERHFGIKYRGTERMAFHQMPVTNGQQAEAPHCENAVFKRKKWIRINDRDLTGVLWLKDYNDAPPFDLKKHVYGGKLEFPVYNFGFQPQAGTMVVYPACERFISLTSPIQVGDLQFVRFHICGEGLWIYDPQKFPGDFRTWFNDVV